MKNDIVWVIGDDGKPLEMAECAFNYYYHRFQKYSGIHIKKYLTKEECLKACEKL